METKVVSRADENGVVTHRVIVAEETAIARMRRVNLQQKAIEANKEDNDEDVKMMRFVIYSDCVAATAVWDKPESKIGFDEFIALPAQFVDDWIEAVWDLIPNWRPRLPEPTPEELEVDRKKEQN